MCGMNQYGIDIKTLDKFITKPEKEPKDWGFYILAVDVPEFRLEAFNVSKGKEFEFSPKGDWEATIFAEEGNVEIEGKNILAKELIAVPPNAKITISANENSAVYVFSGPADKSSRYFLKTKTTDFRDKYWGTIETITSKNYAAKRIFVRKGDCASLEYHCRKIESYFIHSGKLLLRLRAGRGEDRFFELEKGTSSFTPPGLMHQRGGLEDTVIIEISTRDEDSDSFLVEDGAKIKMPNLLDPPHKFYVGD